MNKREYYPIKVSEMAAFMKTNFPDFKTIHIPGTVELVYAKGMHRTTTVGVNIPLSLRLYTSLTLEGARNVGDDAIRVVVYAAYKQTVGGIDIMNAFPVGKSGYLKRIQTWEKNLKARLDTWEDMMIYCPQCGAPCVKRSPKNGQTWQPFYGCIRYVDGCKGSILC